MKHGQFYYTKKVKFLRNSLTKITLKDRNQQKVKNIFILEPEWGRIFEKIYY